MCIQYCLFTCVLGVELLNTGPTYHILFNHSSAYCVLLCSSKGFEMCKTVGPKLRPKWPAFCSCSFLVEVREGGVLRAIYAISYFLNNSAHCSFLKRGGRICLQGLMKDTSISIVHCINNFIFFRGVEILTFSSTGEKTNFSGSERKLI